MSWRWLYVWAIFSNKNEHNFCIYHESYLGIFVVSFYQIPYLGNRVFSKLVVIQKYTQIPNTLSQRFCCVVIDVTTLIFNGSTVYLNLFSLVHKKYKSHDEIKKNNKNNYQKQFLIIQCLFSCYVGSLTKQQCSRHSPILYYYLSACFQLAHDLILLFLSLFQLCCFFSRHTIRHQILSVS